MDIEGFKAYNLEKWKRIEGTLPGLSVSQTGANEATFILGFWSEAVGEQRVIIGRPALQAVRPNRDALVIDGGENVSMREIEEIVACWRVGKRYIPKKQVR